MKNNSKYCHMAYTEQSKYLSKVPFKVDVGKMAMIKCRPNPTCCVVNKT